MQPLPGFSIRGARHGHSAIPAAPQPAALVDIEGSAFRILDLVPGTKLPHVKPSVRGWADQRKSRSVVVAIPNVAIGKGGKRPASIHQKAILSGDLSPTSVFASECEPPVVTGPQLAGMLLILNVQHIARWLGIEAVIFEVQTGALTLQPSERNTAHPDFLVWSFREPQAVAFRKRRFNT